MMVDAGALALNTALKVPNGCVVSLYQPMS
jgi:hypothetical protein